MLKVYDYYCDNCKTTEERFVKSVYAHQVCEKCGWTMRRLNSSPAMVKTNHVDKTGFRK